MKQNYILLSLVFAFLFGPAFTSYGQQLSFSSTPNTDATVGVPYSYSAFASDGSNKAPVLTSPTLPDWMTFAANGSTSMETFGPAIYSPGGIAGDAVGNTYVVTSNRNDGYIYKIAPDGTANTTWAAVDDGDIYAMHVEGDYLYVSYYVNFVNGTSCIKKISLTNPSVGQTMVYNSGAQYRLLSLVFEGGYIYSASYGSSQILKIDPSNGTATEYVSTPGPFGLGFNSSGVLYIANINNGTITSYDGTSTTTETTGLVNPTDVKVDNAGNVYVSNYSGGIVKYNSTFTTSNWLVSNEVANRIWGMNLTPTGSLVFGLNSQNTVARLGTGAVLSGTPGSADIGVHEVTIRATSDTETVDQNFTITVTDIEAPAGYTVSIDQAEINETNQSALSFTFAQAEVGTTYDYIISSDNGGTDVTGTGTIATATDQIRDINVSSLENGTLTLSVTLTDASENTGTAVTDDVLKNITNNPPSAVCKDYTAKLDASGVITILPENVDGGSSDDKAGFTLTLDQDTFDCSNIGTPVTVTLTVTDSDGVKDTCTANVTVEDNVAPVAIAQDITVELDNNGQAIVTAVQINNGSTDNCTADADLTFSLDKTLFSCEDLGENSSASNPSYIGSRTQFTNSHGGGYNPNTKEFLYPMWAGSQVNTYDASHQASGSFTAPVNQIMQIWMDNNSTDYYTANWGNNTVNRIDGTNNIVWSYNLGTMASGITTNDGFVYAMAFSSNIIKVLNKETGEFIKDIVLPGAFYIYGGLVYANELLYIAGRDLSGISPYHNQWNAIHAFNAETGEYINSVSTSVPTYNTSFDGENIWISDNSNIIYGYQVSEGNAYGSNGGSNQVTLTVKDRAGNESTASANIIVVDKIAPVVETKDISINLDETGNASITPAMVIQTSSDNCGIDNSILDVSNFTLDDVGKNTVTLTVTDIHENVTTTTSVVTVKDVTAPKDYTVSIDQTEIDENNQNTTSFTFGNAEVGTTYNYTFSSDNGGTNVTGSGSISNTSDQITGIDLSGLEDGIITLSVTLTDASSNEGVAATDTKIKATNQEPVAVCKDFTAQLDASGIVTILPENVDGGSSDDKPGFILTLDQDTFDCSNIGTPVTVTLTVTDSDGVKDTCTATVTVEDNVAPVAIAQDITVALDDNGQAIVTAAQINNGSTDNCGISDISFYKNGEVGVNFANGIFSGGQTHVEFKTGNNAPNYRGDDYGTTCNEAWYPNGTFCDEGSSQNSTDVSFKANTASGATWRNNASGSSYGILVIDLGEIRSLSSASVFQMFSDGKTTDIAMFSHPENSDIPPSFDDSSWNEVFGKTRVGPGVQLNPQEVGDPTKINFDFVNARYLKIRVWNDGTYGSPSWIELRNLKLFGQSALNRTTIEYDCSNIGENSVSLFVTDKNGNESTATATVTVEDNTAPQAIAKNIIVALDENGTASVTPEMVDNGSLDNCTASEDLQLSLDKFVFGCEDVVDKGITPNLSALNFDGDDYVSIPDSPELQLQGDMSIEAWFKVDEFTGDWVRVVGKGPGPAGPNPVGPRNYGLWYLPNGTWLFQQYGDAVEVSFNRPINIGEWYHFAAVKTGNLAKLYINGEVVASNTGGTNPLTSNDPLTIGYAGFHDHHIGQIDEVRLWNIARTDEEIVNDYARTINPDTPGLLAYYNMEEVSGNVLNDQTANSFNGDLQQFSQSEVLIRSSKNLGPLSTTLTVTDESGNSSSAIATITVEDNIAPEVLTQDITVELDANGMAAISVQDIDSGTKDACGIESLSLDTTDFTCENIGENIVTLKVMDVNGNEASATATVTVEDNAAPLAIAKDIIVQLDENGAASITTEMINNGSSDNCTNEANLIYTVSPDNFSCEDIVTSCVNSALSFSSANDQVLIGDLGAVEDWTIEFWFFNNGNINYQNMFHTNWPNNNAGVRIEKSQNWPNGHLYVSVSGDGNFRPNTIVPLNGALSMNEWHHLAIIGDKRNNKVVAYLDGTKTTENPNSSWPANFPNMVIGRGFSHSAERDFDGAMDDFRIWNKVLTQDEVTANMNKSLTGSEDNLIHYWNFNDGTGSEIVKDIAGNKDGVLSGADVNSAWIDGPEQISTNCGNEVVLSVTDESGNTATATAIVTVEDNIAAEVLTQDITIQLDENGMASIEVSDIDNGSNDACGIASLELDITDFTCENVGPNTVTLTAKDNNGNESSATATVTVEDNIAAEVLTQDITIQLDENGMASIEVSDIDNGSNDACGIESLELDVTEFTCENVGENTVTLTATDVNENVSSATAVVTVVDNIAAKVLTQNITVELDENGMAMITPYMIDNGSTDNCEIASLVLDVTEFTCNNVGENTVTLTATDVNENVSSATAVVTVVDNIAAKVLTQNITVELDENGMAMITPDMIDNGSSDNCEIADLVLDVTEFTCDDVGENTVTLTATDVNENVSSETATVTVEDNVASEVLTQDITIQLDENGIASILVSDIDNGSNDACGIESLELNMTDFNCAHVGANTVTLIAKDVNGNVSSETAIVTVEDNVAATVLTQNITVELDENGMAMITPEMIDNGSSDNCEIASLELDIMEFNCENVGENTVTLIAKDVNGNVSSATAVVTVVDNIAANVLTQNITVELDENGMAMITPDMIDNGSSDNCEIASLELDVMEFNCDNVGENTVTLTATDVSENVSSATAVVTVVDNIAAMIVTQNVTVELDENGLATVTPDMIDNGSSDNCEIASLELDVMEFNCDNVGENTVTLTATDVNENVSSATAVVTVVDNIAAKVLARDITIELDEMGMATITIEDIDNGSNDACGIESLELDVTEFTCENVGLNTVTLTANDVNGNVSSATASITVEDNIAPVPVMEQLDTIYAECIVEKLDVAAPLAIDNCQESIEAVADLYFPVTRQGSTVITWKYEDAQGNLTYQQQEIIIEDTTAPVANIAELETIEVECGVTDIAAPMASDNCAGILVGITSDELNYSEQGEYVITWTYDDGNGNTSTQDQLVIVNDVTAPDVITRDITIVIDPRDNVRISPEDIDAGSSDNCSDITLSLDQDYFEQPGFYDVTLSARDAVGNTGSAIARVTVVMDAVDTKEAHVVPTLLRRNSKANVILPFRGQISSVEVIETETNRFRSFSGNKRNKMEIDVAPFKGTLLVRITDIEGTVYLKKLIAY